MFHPSYRNLKQEQIQIRFNLVVAIAIAQIIFLAGIDASETKVNHRNPRKVNHRNLRNIFSFFFMFSVVKICPKKIIQEKSQT